MKEIWKDIKGYEGHYQISNLGRVKSLSRIVNGKDNSSYIINDRILRLSLDNDGYYCITLKKDRKIKHHRVCRLVAGAYIDNPLLLPCVNHKDENKSNDCVENLEWCTANYNNNYGTRNERIGKSNINRHKSKKIICAETGVIYTSICEAERLTGIYVQNISRCCNGKSKTAGGYHWKFVE